MMSVSKWSPKGRSREGIGRWTVLPSLISRAEREQSRSIRSTTQSAGSSEVLRARRAGRTFCWVLDGLLSFRCWWPSGLGIDSSVLGCRERGRNRRTVAVQRSDQSETRGSKERPLTSQKLCLRSPLPLRDDGLPVFSDLLPLILESAPNRVVVDLALSTPGSSLL